MQKAIETFQLRLQLFQVKTAENFQLKIISSASKFSIHSNNVNFWTYCDITHASLRSEE